MAFARTSRVRKDFTEDLSNIPDEIRETTGDETVGTATEINSALLDTAKHFEAAAESAGRRAILILTDNLGLNYRVPDDQVLQALYSANTVLNAIVVGKGERPAPITPERYTNPDYTPPNVFKLSEETGGEAVQAEKAGQAFANLIERIRTRYSIHYSKPPEATKGFRKVRVELTPGARMRYPRVELRARKGYTVTE
jgi:hypothetical protein